MLKQIKIGSNIIKAHLYNKKVPLSVLFYFSRKCNIKCAYCDIPNWNVSEFTNNEILTLIDDISKAGGQRIGLVGGEPLIRKDIGLFIDRAKNNDMFVSITTNGTLIKSNLNKLQNIDMVLVSLDGPQEVHNATRDSVSVDKLLSNINLLRDNNIPVAVTSVLSKMTIDHLDDLFYLSKKHNLYFNYQPLTDFQTGNMADQNANNIDSNRFLPSLSEFKKAINKIIQEKKNGGFVTNSYSYLNLVKNGFNLEGDKCLAGKRFCYVDTNGDVYPCMPYVNKIEAKNIKKVGFIEAFNSIPEFTCADGCIWPCYIEYNYLFSLQIESIINTLRVLKY
tara:strand:+ start:357 stop:1361 length:1005 start_codon:yes stop_codon:yes gene_type:complete